MELGSRLLHCPSELREARANRRLVVFAGSGVSADTTRPTWNGFIERLVSEAQSNGLDAGKVKQLNGLMGKSDKTAHMKFVALEARRWLSKDSSAVYHDCLKSALEPPDVDPIGTLHSSIINLAPLAIVTPNYDLCFEECAEEAKGANWSSVIVDNDFDIGRGLAPETVYHLHGSLNRLDSLVVTLLDYRKAYRESSQLDRFLAKLFGRYSILFIGCSFADEEILSDLVRSADLGRHHALVEVGSAEQYLFQAMDIRVTPYEVSGNRHFGLKQILGSWLKELNSDESGGPRRAETMKNG